MFDFFAVFDVSNKVGSPLTAC